MAANAPRTGPKAIHPLHAVLLAGTVPLFVGGLLGDLAYWNSYEVQWINFAAWLIAGGMVFTGAALLWAAIDLVRSRRRAGRPLIYFLILLGIFGLGVVNALQHARDAWGTMPAGLVLSAIVAILAILATWTGFSSLRAGDPK